MSKTRIIIHIVFATKHRKRTITLDHKRDLYAYIMGIVNNTKSTLIRINGIGDHIHLLIDLHPTVALATLVRDVKIWSSKWLRENPKFPYFESWGDGYYAVSLSADDVEECRNYIINQEDHHLKAAFEAEMEWMAVKNGLRFYKDDFD